MRSSIERTLFIVIASELLCAALFVTIRNVSGVPVLTVFPNSGVGIGTVTDIQNSSFGDRLIVRSREGGLALWSYAPSTTGWDNQIQFIRINAVRHVILDNLENNTLTLHPGLQGGAVNQVNVEGRLLVGNSNSMPSSSLYPNWQVAVNGELIAKRVVVQTANWSWADYVFDNNYKLMPLEQVEEYIKQNGHLPEIPDECEVQEKGIDTGEMNRLLLQKVEELTLHLIALKKEVEVLKK